MIKKIFFFVITVIFIVGTYYLLHSNIGFRSDFTLAKIETGVNKLKSEIAYYDEDLNLIYIQTLPFARLGKNFMDLNEKKLMLSGGTDWIGCKYVIELDSNNGKVKKYYVDQAYNLAMTANNKYVFASYTAKDSSISRCNKNTGEIKKMSIPDIIVGCLYTSDDSFLYAFGGDAIKEKSNLYIIDPEKLKILKTFNIKDKGYYQERCMKIGDDLYFLNYCTFEKLEHGTKCWPASTMTKFNTKTYEFEDIKVEKWPREFFKCGDMLYITHNESLYEPTNKLTLYNLKTGEQTLKELEDEIYDDSMAIDEKNQKLYLASPEGISQYDLKTLKPIKTVKGYSEDDDLYGSTLFVK